MQKLFTEATVPSILPLFRLMENSCQCPEERVRGEEFCPEECLTHFLLLSKPSGKKFSELLRSQKKDNSPAPIWLEGRCLLLILKTEKKNLHLYHAYLLEAMSQTQYHLRKDKN